MLSLLGVIIQQSFKMTPSAVASNSRSTATKQKVLMDDDEEACVPNDKYKPRNSILV